MTISAAMRYISADERDRGAMPPEQRLFRNVIIIAVLDAIHGVSITREDDRLRAKRQAWQWFLEAGDDFRFVCECADLEPVHVRKSVLKYVLEQREIVPVGRTRLPRWRDCRADAGLQ